MHYHVGVKNENASKKTFEKVLRVRGHYQNQKDMASTFGSYHTAGQRPNRMGMESDKEDILKEAYARRKKKKSVNTDKKIRIYLI